MYKMKWTIQNANNAVLTADNAMPLKDSTSNNEGRFQMDRQTFIQTIPSVIPADNKWMGESRDASDVMRRRRAGAVGKGTFNANGNQFSFTNPDDKNSRNNALRRVRAGGSVAPVKKGARK
jgi:hypothetical protein